MVVAAAAAAYDAMAVKAEGSVPVEATATETLAVGGLRCNFYCHARVFVDGICKMSVVSVMQNTASSQSHDGSS